MTCLPRPEAESVFWGKMNTHGGNKAFCVEDLGEPDRTLQRLLRVWLGQDVGRVNNVKMNTSGNRLWGHELGQMAGIRVIMLRKTIFWRKLKVEVSKTMMRKRVVNWKMLFNLICFCGVGHEELPPVPGHSRAGTEGSGSVII